MKVFYDIGFNVNLIFILARANLRIKENTDDIADFVGKVMKNSLDIGINAANIADNEEDVSDNASAIDENNEQISKQIEKIEDIRNSTLVMIADNTALIGNNTIGIVNNSYGIEANAKDIDHLEVWNIRVMVTLFVEFSNGEYKN